MATVGDRKLPKKRFQREFLKYQVLQCFGKVERNFSNTSPKKSSGVSDQVGNSVATGISELEQMMKQVTFTRFEKQRLTALSHSRTSEESMSSLPHQTTMENLSDDLLSDIFIRLLAKQLAQMRCVSKSWNALLSQSSFVTAHLNRSIQINDQVLLAFHKGFPFGSRPFTALSSQSTHNKLIKSINIPASARVIGSVNGLICFYDNDDSVIHIWNPSLSAMLTLPPSTLPFPLVACGYNSIETSYQFGFDPNTNDYKVVRLTGLSHNTRYSSGTVYAWLPVDVYSMRRGSWELITQEFPSHFKTLSVQEHAFVRCFDGRLHWAGWSRETRTKTVVGFNLGSLTFSVIHLPSIRQGAHFTEIGVFAGKLCVTSMATGYACELWVMEEYGVTESWVKRHVFSHLITVCYLSFGFTLRDEFLYEGEDCPLVLYHPVADKATNFEELGTRVDCVVEYIDSLVWVAPTERVR